MQTFLPYRSFYLSAECLDRFRLGKQRIEVVQILRILAGDTPGWRWHPTVKMWQGYGALLAYYGRVICEEWRRRGYKDTQLELVTELGKRFKEHDAPPWLGDQRVHASHRAALLFKNPAWYGKFGWIETPTGPDANGRWQYHWPV